MEELTDQADLEAFLAQLSREPDFDAPELRAYDAADLLLLSTAADLLAERGEGLAPRSLVVIGDRHGALTLGALRELDAGQIRVYQDPLLQQRALAANAQRFGLAGRYESVGELDESLVTGATLVLMQLPRSLAELEQTAWLIARHADPSVTVLTGGRDKHMSLGMNSVLSRYFGEVAASRGWRKARVLTARGPEARVTGEQERQPRPPFPVWGSDPDLPFHLAAFGATFGGATLDHGSRLLLRTLREHPPAIGARPDSSLPARIVDLGCGNGVLAVSVALAFAGAEVIATDQSTDAVRATRLTAEAAGVSDRVSVHRADATEAVPDGWADLVLLNPPFHAGSTVHAGVAHRLIRSCSRALAPGGELRIVFNSHLAYRSLVEREIGPARQLARDKTFTVLSACLPAAG